jgi:hypothetical protein
MLAINLEQNDAGFGPDVLASAACIYKIRSLCEASMPGRSENMP